MRTLKINISAQPQIMINSQEVWLDITRQCAQVEHKNRNILARKII
jgi:hypothetical protein